MKITTSTGIQDTRKHLRNAPLKKFKDLLTIHGLIFLFFFSGFLVPLELAAQTSAAFDLPDNCKAKDLEPLKANLTGLPSCIDCDGQQSWPATLSLEINNTTGSERTSFAFWAILETTDGSGTTTTLYVYGCDGPVLPGINPLEFDELVFYEENNPTEPIEFDLIYECGSTLKLTDMVMAWTPAASNGNECPLIGSNIPSKCGSIGEIQINTPVTGISDVVDVSCYEGEDGFIDLTPSGGVPPYSYEWSMLEDPDFTSSEEDLVNIGAGTYSVIITDSTTPDACDFTLGPIVVEEPGLLDADVASVSPDCYAEDATGSITVTNPSGGSGAYEYSIGDGWQSSGQFDNVAIGNDYVVQIRDQNAPECIVTVDEDVDITLPAMLSLNLTPTAETCSFNDGSISINISGGTGGYKYSYDGVNFQSSIILTGLSAGIYTIYVMDINACIISEKVTVAAPENCQIAEGCTLGYWKNHTDRWCDAYETCTRYGDVFENAPAQLAELSLLEVLNLGGGGINNLGRQSVAALLNACSNEVDYEFETTAEVITYVNANFGRNQAGAAGTYLDELNNAGCPLGGTSATSAPSEGCETDEANNGNNGNNGKPDKKDEVAVSKTGFSAYPVPFKEMLNIKYDFDYQSPVTIQFFDMRGKLLRTVKEAKAYNGKVTTINIDFSMRANQMYILKLTTDRETFVKQIISGR